MARPDAGAKGTHFASAFCVASPGELMCACAPASPTLRRRRLRLRLSLSFGAARASDSRLPLRGRLTAFSSARRLAPMQPRSSHCWRHLDSTCARSDSELLLLFSIAQSRSPFALLCSRELQAEFL